MFVLEIKQFLSPLKSISNFITGKTMQWNDKTHTRTFVLKHYYSRGGYWESKIVTYPPLAQSFVTVFFRVYSDIKYCFKHFNFNRYSSLVIRSREFNFINALSTYVQFSRPTIKLFPWDEFNVYTFFTFYICTRKYTEIGFIFPIEAFVSETNCLKRFLSLTTSYTL